jgi:hypothetical protein
VRELLAAGLLCLGSGCIAFLQEPVPVESLAALRAAPPPKLTIGFEEPQLRADKPDLLALNEIRRSRETIEALRGTGLFADVDYVRQLARPPDLTLRLEVPKYQGEPSPWAFPAVLTLGILPGLVQGGDAVAFSIVGSKAEPFEFVRRETSVFGLVAPLFPLLSSSWSLSRDPYQRDAFALYLASRRDELWGASHSGAANAP